MQKKETTLISPKQIIGLIFILFENVTKKGERIDPKVPAAEIEPMAIDRTTVGYISQIKTKIKAHPMQISSLEKLVNPI